MVPNPINISVLANTQQVFPNIAQINGSASVSIMVTSGSWLSADASALTPAPFSISINTQGLLPSSTPYQGSLLVQCNGVAPCIAQTVPVNLTVYSQVTVKCTPATGPTQVGVAYSTTCVAAGGSNSFIWSLGAGSLPAGLSFSATTGNTIQVSGTPTTAGPYSFTVRTSENGPQVQLASQIFSGTIAAAAPPTLTAAPSTVPLGSYTLGGTVPGAVNIALTSTNPASGMAFTSTLGSGCAWLTLSPSAGSTPATINASVNSANATLGNHSCPITFSATGVSASTTVTATLTVINPTPTLTALPSTVSFGLYTIGTAVPAGQIITVGSTNPTSGVAFTTALGPDCAWLTLSPVSGSTPAAVNASLNSDKATPGSHSCLITFNSNGISPSPTVTVNLTIAPGNPPAISAIVNAAGFAPGGSIATGSWVSLFGTNLAPAGDSRLWNTTTEIVNGQFPTSLDGTSVTVNGKAATVEYISPTQVNIQPPDDTAVGPVQVVMSTTAGGAGAAFTVNYAQFAPGLFLATTVYLAAQHGDGSYVGAYPGSTPAIPGEVITLWGSGFGPANPPVPSGKIFSGVSPLANPVTVTIGGQPASVDFAGIVGAGLVQINVHVPDSISNGDAAVVATVGGVPTQSTTNLIAVHN